MKITGHKTRSVFDRCHVVSPADLQEAEKQPAFYTKMNPASFLLVKLTYQTEKDIRYVIATGSAFSNTVSITINKRADESFQLVPSSGLEPGEYAFLSAALFYDLGVE